MVTPRQNPLLPLPNTKSRFWSKKNLNFDLKNYVDLGVFDFAEFKFWDLGSKFERNLRESDFEIFQN